MKLKQSQRIAQAQQTWFDELNRLKAQLEHSVGRGEQDYAVADLLVFLGVIHNTPAAKADWIEGKG